MFKYLKNKIKLKDAVNEVLIVAHNEDTSHLEKALKTEGFKTTIIKTDYNETQKKYSSSTRCLINHKKAWDECIKDKELKIIVEADFVPVRGFANLPVPFPPAKADKSFGYLYSGSSRLFWFDSESYPMGHTTTMVSYVVNHKVAKILVKFFENEMKTKNPETYFPWDTYLSGYFFERDYSVYLPFRCYGEHGGFPNPEHKKSGLNPSHQADVLWGRLHFLPLYSKNKYSKFYYVRIKAKLIGIARLFLNRYIMKSTLKCYKSKKEKFKLIIFGIYRIISVY